MQSLQSVAVVPKLSEYSFLEGSYPQLDRLFAGPLCGIDPATIEDITPCSQMQGNFLLSQVLDPGNYQCSFVVKFTSTAGENVLEIDKFAQAWKQVVARHSILRTSIVESTQRAANFDQVVWKNIESKIEIHDDCSSLLGVTRILSVDNLNVPHLLTLVKTSPIEIVFRLDICSSVN
nr:nonribosomal peptide synthetase easa [Quercus suber]